MAADGLSEYDMVDGKITFLRSILKGRFTTISDISIDPFRLGRVYFTTTYYDRPKYLWNPGSTAHKFV
jgi:hypothetical protein